METSHLTGKISRLYAAIGQARELELTKFAPQVTYDAHGGLMKFHQDFRGGLTDAELAELAYASIRAIGDLRDHLRVWAHAHGREKDAVDEAVRKTVDLGLVIDLANFDKHGAHDRNGGWSKKSPRLRDIRRVLQMTGPGAVAFPLSGPRASGGANVAVVITGDVVDAAGQRIVDLDAMLENAVAAWETMFDQFGIEYADL